MSVLLWGVPSEPPVAMVARALHDRKVDVVVVHPGHVDDQEVSIHADDGAPAWELKVGERRFAVDDLAGAYLRPVDPAHVTSADLTGAVSRAARGRRVFDALSGFTELMAARGARVLNPLSAMLSNVSKPYQAQAVMAAGFATPVTLVTDDPQEVLSFAADHGEIVYKSTSGVRSIVTSFDPAADSERLDRLRWCPVQFQERVGGPDVRVHVVGDEVLAALATTSAVDYRYAHRQVGSDADLVAYRLDDDVAERCRALARDLGLPFAGIDLKLSPDGRVVCFEVNPAPGFTWYETAAGLPIAATVARYLTSLSAARASTG